MATKSQPSTESPSGSSILAPLDPRSRHGSIGSLSAASHIGKEILNQALDQIHSTASQSEALTTFSEFQAPPSASAGTEGKGIASELQGGLSGLYSRLKASVGSAREIVGGGADGGSWDDTPLPSPKPATPTPTPTAKQFPSSPKVSNLSTNSLRSEKESATRVQSPLASASNDGQVSDKAQVIKSQKSPSIVTVSGSQHSISSPSPLKSPLTQATLPTAAVPAVVEINVSVVKESSLQSTGSTKFKDTNLAVPTNGVKSLRSEELLSVAAEKQEVGGVKSEFAEPSQTVGPDSGEPKGTVPQTSGLGTNNATYVRQPIHELQCDQERRAARISESRVDDDGIVERAVFDGHNESGGTINKVAVGEAYDNANNATPLENRPQEKVPSIIIRPMGTEDKNGLNRQLVDSAAQKALLPPRVQPHLPGFNLSRTSSTDTAGGSSINTLNQHTPNHDDAKRNMDGLRALARPQTESTATTRQAADTRAMNVGASQIRSKILSKEYWMRDENARDCFYCGDSFSTFRRKHHCRTCGQIFDSKCTSLVDGKQFGQSGSLRVCKPCEGIINGYDDSSEYSDDSSIPNPGLRPRHGSTSTSDVSPAKQFLQPRLSALQSSHGSPRHSDHVVPTISIPATRRTAADFNGRSAVLEIDAEQALVRPGSSKSLKSSFGSRAYPSNHKRHYSRHEPQRGFKPVHEESAPFHRNPAGDIRKEGRLPAFHSDNIIDPDLAPFLSDEGSSGDEQVSIMTAMNSEGLSRSFEPERNGVSGLLAAAKKNRSRMGEKTTGSITFAGRDADNVSLNSAKMARNSKRRNLSVSGNVHLRPSPRAYRASVAVPGTNTNLQESLSSSVNSQSNRPSTPGSGSRMMRSSSMRGADAPPVELNSASLQHVRKLLRQLLQDSDVPSTGSWEKALMPILLQATDDVNPHVQNGDDIDIRHYVKLKKIPGGRPGDTSYVSGLVFTKNLALKSMPRKLSYPSILILTFPLEYARHQQHFMSLEPVIRQEREFLQNLVHRIAALHPQLLLVERNVSGLALEFLEQANIATAYNVKASVLEAVSRCAQTRIISSIDKLAIKPAQAGKCASFYLKTYVHGGRKKTYMFLSGCPKELGCTIVLRGANNVALAKIKRITEFMVYVVYNLKLETCLMRDEFALIPSYTDAGSIFSGTDIGKNTNPTVPSDTTIPDNPIARTSNKLREVENSTNQGSTDASNADILKKGPTTITRAEKEGGCISDEIQMPEDVPMPTFYLDMVEKHKTKILSASPFVKFMQPYLLMRAREQERRLSYLKRLRDQDLMEAPKLEDASKPQKFDLIKPEMVHETVRGASNKVREVLHAVHDAEYDKALHNYQTQKKQWEAYIAGNINLFDPYAHQNIAVLYSVVCTVTTVPCSGPDVLALGFYNEHETDADFEADCTLGQYVEDLCLGANTVCTANGCERKMFEHHRQYVHGEAQLSVFVEHHSCKLRGLQDTILMWSTCRICGNDTQVMPMSDSTWKYSFGKYLELSFWSSELHARADVCPHDLHRNHIRYFGFKDVALRVQYDPITLLEIIVPRTRVTWKVDNDLRFKNEIFTKTEDRLNKFMLSVKARIKSIKVDTVVPEKSDACRDEIDKLMKRATEEHLALIRKLQNKYMNSKYYEIIPLNRAVRATQEKVAEWDNIFADFDRNFFPSEKDIRRLATLQLKKIFLDRDESVTSLTSSDEGTGHLAQEEYLSEKKSLDDTPALSPQTRRMSPEKAHDMLTSVVEENASSVGSEDHYKSAPPTSVHAIQTSAGQNFDSEDIRHLDLALPSYFPERAPYAQSTRVPESRPVSPTTPRDTKKVEGRPYDTSIIPHPEADHDDEQATEPNVPSKQGPMSGIPRLPELSIRRVGTSISPPLYRAQSQPAHLRREKSNSSGGVTPIAPLTSASNNPAKRLGEPLAPTTSDSAIKVGEKKISERLGLNALKQTGVSTHSMIPRSIASGRKDSRVSTLAKHFEQLSREFEKERLRERRQRAAKSRQARAYPMAASKPIVQIYRNVHDAVEERDPSDEDLMTTDLSNKNMPQSSAVIDGMAQQTSSQTPGEGLHAEETAAEDTTAEDTAAENTETDECTHVDSHAGSDVELEGTKSDEDHSLLDEIHIPDVPETHDLLSPSEAQLDLKLDLPKHEKTSLMKMLTNFWAERSASGWQALEYPLNASDHVFADSDIIVREDEPSSLIAFALGSEDYQAKLRSIQEKSGGLRGRHERSHLQDPMLDTDEQVEVEQSLLRSTGTHLKYQFQEGSAKMLCKIFYAEQFDAVRRKCGVAERVVESLSRCLKWDSKGGKTKSVFLKTLDDRFVLKSLSQIETQAFLRFAPAYFRIMSEALFHELPSVIAKMLGFYQIIIKNPVTGVEFNWFLLVMENLFYDRSPTRIFDLKGSMRNRRIHSTGEQNEVLLDENMVEFIYESPLFAREHSKKLLRASVWNDTLFLARQNVMDYSLMIAIDENRQELVVGIIDCIRTYTWDKKLESWMKDRGKNRPTVTSPKEYKSRFREAMGRYVLQAPNCWHQFKGQHYEPWPLKIDDRMDTKDGDRTDGEMVAVGV